MCVVLLYHFLYFYIFEIFHEKNQRQVISKMLQDVNSNISGLLDSECFLFS